ncbi:type II secretion system minor pseudopilin GspH [Thalassotalea sp. PLHSN55]|uniref:type II secretion system minor pseudopilin GspH n=1 Tax=Thalassotalea sp. PLHSN55 TaxID=3435888 RepID=UPI003F82DA1E
MKSAQQTSAIKNGLVKRNLSGFTLIEVMLVIVLIGLMASAIQFNLNTNEPDKVLEKTSARFAGIFDIAAEYSMLNNVEIGVVVDKNSYRFLGYDGTGWSEIPEQPILTEVTLPEGVIAEVELEDLPIDEPLLFDAKTFNSEDDEEFLSYDNDEDDDDNNEDKNSEDKKKKKIVPQVYILSGGDITPFSITFSFEDDSLIEQDLAYRVTGVYSTPLIIEGPTLDD